MPKRLKVRVIFLAKINNKTTKIDEVMRIAHYVLNELVFKLKTSRSLSSSLITQFLFIISVLWRHSNVLIPPIC